MADIQDTSSGRTSPVRSAPTRARTSSPSSKRSARSKDTKFILLDLRSGRPPERSWQTISVSHGGYLMRSTGEFPNAENVSTLSQILQAGVPEKYYLSPKACLGILRRASVRGKELPELLKKGSGTAGCVCLNDQGGNRMDVTDGVTCTLRAEKPIIHPA